MRWGIPLLCCCAVSVSGYAHERTGAGPGPEMHALYHKVKASYRFVDALKLREQLTNREEIYFYYFDPATDSLYSCIGEESYAVCAGPERASQFSWSSPEVSYGQRNELAPIDRLFHGPVYFLEGTNPFSQFTTYVYYSGRARVVRCRKTLTSYNFEVARNGEHLYFSSEKKDERAERCEQLYPRP